MDGSGEAEPTVAKGTPPSEDGPEGVRTRGHKPLSVRDAHAQNLQATPAWRHNQMLFANWWRASGRRHGRCLTQAGGPESHPACPKALA